jgi:transcription elongation factor GreA
MTREGIERLKRELEELEGVRLAEATANGSGTVLADSTEHAEAKAQLAMLHERIAGLRRLLGRVQPISDEEPNREVGLGSRVVLFLEDEREEVSYRVVGTIEADPLAGQLSNQSPLGRVLMGKKAGQRVRWSLPGGRTSTALIREVQ